MTTNIEQHEIISKLQKFANDHKVVLELDGEVGFGRPCVGFTHGKSFINYHPRNIETIDLVFPEDDTDYCPDSVTDAYHKHDCVAVLVQDGNKEEAIRQLGLWVDHLVTLGVELVEYETGAKGLNLIFHGVIKRALKKKVRKLPILCLEFDGVCHSYSSGWQGVDVIPDPPVEDLFVFLTMARFDFDIHIFSSRSREERGIAAMKAWFAKHEEDFRQQHPNASGLTLAVTPSLSFPTTKPPAYVSLDDRAITFNGRFPNPAELLAFEPWYRQNGRKAKV